MREPALYSNNGMEIWLIIGFVALWFVFQLWLGPKLGIPTCLSGACALDPRKESEKE